MLTLDFANCLSERVAEHGLDPARLAPGSDLAAAATRLTESLATTRGTGWERWRDLPFGDFRKAHTEAIHELVKQRKPGCEVLVVLGIGGSALGNIALQSALNPGTWNLIPSDQRGGPQLFVLDNVDPTFVGPVLNHCERVGLDKCLFNVVSKSGETAETAAQFMIVRDMLKAKFGDKHADHVVACTDPAKGTMRTICDNEGYATLPVPEGVGGRFSVLSPVGLFSAAMCGIDIEALLDGAAEIDKPCSNPDLAANPAAMLATLLVELAARKGKHTHVLMPYANSLYLLADWFRQLWAESLGKRVNTKGDVVHAGYTPVKALGATDQHSQVQLYREGPNDKVFGLIEVDTFDRDLTVPAGMGVDALQYLESKSLATLLNAEKRATEYALVESQRPNFTIHMPKVDAHHVGQFLNLWQITTAYAGLMLGIDAYDQPAVETGKQATFGLMGRAGYEEHLESVNRTLGSSAYRIG